MANSKYEYVKNFELDDRLLPDCWLVVRVDGKQFKPFTESQGWTKPYDDRGTKLMNRCAEEVMKQCGDIVMAMGNSDEFSFILRRDTTLFKRRASKIATYLVSLFTSQFVFHYNEYFCPGSSPVCVDLRRPGEHTASTMSPTIAPSDVAPEVLLATGRTVEESEGTSTGAIRAKDFATHYAPSGRHRTLYAQRRGISYAAERGHAPAAPPLGAGPDADQVCSRPLLSPPSFDGRVVCYPSDQTLRDYLSWRQVDFHVNCLYNTCFWHLAHDEYGAADAEAKLCGTFSEDKHELLHRDYATNYARLPAAHRKGSFLLWLDEAEAPAALPRAVEAAVGEAVAGSTPVGPAAAAGTDAEAVESTDAGNKRQKQRDGPANTVQLSAADSEARGASKRRRVVVALHEDVIQDGFWQRHPGLIPFVSAAQLAREQLKAEKKKRKEMHKEQRARDKAAGAAERAEGAQADEEQAGGAV